MFKIKLPLLIMTTIGIQMVASAQWNTIDLGTNIHFNTSYFLDEEIGYIAGNKTDFTGTTSIIYKTEDAGSSWMEVKELDIAGQSVSEMNWLSENYCYVATQSTFNDGVLLVSDDAATNLYWVHGLIQEQGVKSISFRNSETGVVVSDLNNVYLTTNSGSSFSDITPDQNTSSSIINKVIFASSTVAYLIGSNSNQSEAVVYRTIDQGSNWSKVFSYMGSDVEIIDLDISSQAMMILREGNNSSVYNSNNGTSWTPIGDVYENQLIQSVQSFNGSQSYAVGYYSDISNSFLLSINNSTGTTESNPSIADTILNDVHFFSDEVAIVIGNDGVVKRWTTPTGVKSINSESISLFPNPVEDKFIIKGNSADYSKYQVEIYSLRGQLIKQISSQLNQQISIEDIESGLYLVSIKQNGKHKYYQKVIIK